MPMPSKRGASNTWSYCRIHTAKDITAFISWLKERFHITVDAHPHTLSSPTHYEGIYLAVDRTVSSVMRDAPDADISFHLSPGTPAMAAIWILLAKGRYNARLIETSPQTGLRDVTIPFELAAEYVPCKPPVPHP